MRMKALGAAAALVALGACSEASITEPLASDATLDARAGQSQKAA